MFRQSTGYGFQQFLRIIRLFKKGGRAFIDCDLPKILFLAGGNVNNGHVVQPEKPPPLTLPHWFGEVS